ncbi:oligosaccharide repeat unit polymerase [Leptothoe sp. EHU-05/26/07-4]
MLIILIILSLLIYSRAFISRSAFLHAPNLVSSAYIFFLVPQMFAFESLDLERTVLNPDAYYWTLVYAIICLLASYLGWRSGCIKFFFRFLCKFSDEIHGKALFFTMIFLSLISNFAAFKFEQLKSSFEYESGQQLTGIGTKILFVARIVYIPYAYFLSQFIEKKSFNNLLLLLATIFLTLQRVITGGRRSPLALILLPVICMLFFRKKITLNRSLIVFILIAPIILIPALAVSRFDFWNSLFSGQISIEFLQKTVVESFTDDYPYDFSNAVNIISLTTDHLYFGLGSGFWNDLVFNFIPGQFLGEDFKDLLYINISPVSYLKNFELNQYFSYKLGTTQTGLGNTFAEFGFLGSICFFFQSKIMRTLWEAAKRGKEVAMIAYCFMTTSIFLSITHGFYLFINYAFLFTITFCFSQIFKSKLLHKLI